MIPRRRKDEETERRPLRKRLRDFVYYRSRALKGVVKNRGPGWLKHRVWRRIVPYRHDNNRLRLHIGSGPERLDGWVNVDLQPLIEVDVCTDLTKSFPFSDVYRIFAEHFLEHLEPQDALDVLVRCHGSLAAGGRLRLSTPNLDWVWAATYGPADSGDRSDRQHQALALNRCFYGWGHRFLWNREILKNALEAAGFDDLVWPNYGESEDLEFSNLERHETWQDSVMLPHVLIVEADKGSARPELLQELHDQFESEFSRTKPATHR